ncbi:Hypothetical predicted protein [Olea europaea subsp. europaea]|uniref:Uncharacterized protein n=1 Tax=Olea europaea subsp. europaea TaxID=158383 RepID=A0A8S0RL34_OLEEU|nr:Hypothetical predicted protein [Olea europaea subsp. europaea]
MASSSKGMRPDGQEKEILLYVDGGKVGSRGGDEWRSHSEETRSLHQNVCAEEGILQQEVGSGLFGMRKAVQQG